LWSLLLPVDKFDRVGVYDAVTLTLNFKVVGNQVNRPTLNERVRRFGWRVAEVSWIASWRVAVSTLAIGRVTWLAVAAGPTASHLLLTSLEGSALGRVGVVWLHVLRLARVTGHVLLGRAHELVRAGVLLWRPGAERLLVKILVVWLLHVI
jgi:hypothetical protein